MFLRDVGRISAVWLEVSESFGHAKIRQHEYTAIMVTKTGMDTPDMGGVRSAIPESLNATRS